MRHAESIGAEVVGAVTPAYFPVNGRKMEHYVTVSQSVSDILGPLQTKSAAALLCILISPTRCHLSVRFPVADIKGSGGGSRLHWA